MHLMLYSFKLVHITGKLLKVAGALSRSPTEGHDNPSVMELANNCEAMIKSLNWPASDSKLNAILEANETDLLISAATEYTLKG